MFLAFGIKCLLLVDMVETWYMYIFLFFLVTPLMNMVATLLAVLTYALLGTDYFLHACSCCDLFLHIQSSRGFSGTHSEYCTLLPRPPPLSLPPSHLLHPLHCIDCLVCLVVGMMACAIICGE